MLNVTPGAGPFWTKGHNLKQLGKGPQGDATYQISRLGLVVSDKKLFHVFPIISYVKHVTPEAGPFWNDLNKLD